ncbi:YuzF family protein [Paraliobacillus ryukyuensis]|uniref:YuzF family protein n=1 Tax=Paraliobacillus ryukyuensis TaxID=200904 RepID=UPI00117C4496|nr:YuzF family protein [Paraliobacillus ryukyuensis]
MDNYYAYQMMSPNHTDGMMQPKPVVVMEPYVYAATTSLVGKYVVIETSRGSISGMVKDAKPDHVAIQQRDSTFFVRLCEIVWIMPDTIK